MPDSGCFWIKVLMKLQSCCWPGLGPTSLLTCLCRSQSLAGCWSEGLGTMLAFSQKSSLATGHMALLQALAVFQTCCFAPYTLLMFNLINLNIFFQLQLPFIYYFILFIRSPLHKDSCNRPSPGCWHWFCSSNGTQAFTLATAFVFAPARVPLL